MRESINRVLPARLIDLLDEICFYSSIQKQWCAFVLCPKKGNKIEDVVLNRAYIPDF